MQIIDKIITDTDTHTLFGVGDLNMKSAKKVKSIRITNTNSSTATTVRIFKYRGDKNILNNNKKSLVVHAGVLPSWSLSDIASANEELTESLKSDPEEFFKTMYSDRSKAISKSTNKKNRRRYLINVFTRMRFLSNNNMLDLKTKVKKPGSKTFKPWFSYEHKALKDVENVIFGHWAALNGVTNHNNIKGIDLGCVWGGSLAAINVEDKSIITVDSR